MLAHLSPVSQHDDHRGKLLFGISRLPSTIQSRVPVNRFCSFTPVSRSGKSKVARKEEWPKVSPPV
jgi:hypothetical protein